MIFITKQYFLDIVAEDSQYIHKRKGIAMKVWIPEITDERLTELVKKIRPMIRRGNSLYYIKPVDPWEVSFIWDPRPVGKAKGLKQLRDITTYHTYDYHGCFKPSIAEVIARIPKKHLTKVVAFEIVQKPRVFSDLNKDKEALSAGYHTAKVRLYTK